MKTPHQDATLRQGRKVSQRSQISTSTEEIQEEAGGLHEGGVHGVRLSPTDHQETQESQEGQEGLYRVRAGAGAPRHPHVSQLRRAGQAAPVPGRPGEFI